MDRHDALSYDFLIVAAGTTHSYFGHDELGRERARFEDAGRCPGAFGGGCCWRSRKPSASTMSSGSEHLLTFVIIGGGPTGVELAGALAEIARQALRPEFDAIDPGLVADHPDRGRAVDPADVSRVAARVGASRAASASASMCWEGRAVTDVSDGVVSLGDQNIDSAHHPLGSGCRRPHRWDATLASAVDRAGRVIVERGSFGRRASREVFVAGDLASFTHQTGEPLPGVAQVAKQQGAHAAAQHRPVA